MRVATESSGGGRQSQQRGDSRTVVLRNGSINFAGAVLPLVVGVFAIPRIVRSLGVDQFGILSLAWAVLGYFTLFDLGLGRATTKFVSELVGRGAFDQAGRVVGSAISISVVMGVAAAAVLSFVTQPLVGHVLSVNPRLAPDAIRVFEILATTLPAVLVSNTLRGALEAHQRFGLVNSVTVPVNAAMFALPAFGAAAGLRLPGIVLLLALSRFAAVTAFAVLCVANFPALRRWPRLNVGLVSGLVRYGAWVTVANIVGSFLTYFDRFAIGATLSTAAVGYYTAPYETVTRLWIFPSSIVGALFPAVSAGAARGAGDEAGELAGSSIKYLLLVVGPIVALLVAFAPQILAMWLGPEFAKQSSFVFQTLAIGVLVNSIAFVPCSLIQALGRVDVPPKLYAIEFVFYVPLLFLLLRHAGIAGAGLAWTARVIADCVLLWIAASSICPSFISSIRKHGIGSALRAVAVFAVATAAIKLAVKGTLLFQVSLIALVLTAFAVVVWRFVLDGADRERLLAVAGGSRIVGDVGVG